MTAPERRDAFMHLASQHQSQIFGFVRTMIRSREDAEDVHQQVLTVLWRKFDQFELGTNFLAWAFRAAELEVRHYRGRLRDPHLSINDEVLSQVAEVMYAEAERGAFDGRQEALERCLQRLSASDRELIEQIYTREKAVGEIAKESGRLSQSISNALRRIRQALFVCVERAIANERNT